MTDTIAIQLTREQQASLNNLRAVIKRQLRPTSSLDPSLVADILLKNSPMMREAGLAQEQYDYLTQIRDRVAEDSVIYARLTSHMATMMDAIDELRPEAGQTHQASLKQFEGLADKDAHKQSFAEAQIAFGRHLLDASELGKAADHYQKAIDLLDKQGLQAAVAEGELGKAYVGRGHFEQSKPHFENALKTVPDGDDVADERAKIQADFASALIQLGDLDEAEKLLKTAMETCNRLGLWTLRGQVRRELAYVDQVRAEKSQDGAVIKAHLTQAENLLQQTIADLLPLSDTLGLAVAYHDLGRVEARQKNFTDAQYHVELSSEMFQRIGNRRNYAVSEVTLGQLMVLKNGDAATANQHIHKALELATQIQDAHTQKQAAESLARIHQIQSKRAVSEKPAVRHQVIDQISFSRAKLSEIGLANYAEVLNPLIAQLEAVEKSGDVPTA